VLNVLLTNDDGVQAEGLRAMHRALRELPDLRVEVIAPDGNRSAMGRSITTRRPLWVTEVGLGDGLTGYATDGTPVDCVRLAALGLVDGFKADLVVAGINHGANLGDDITYSGTVAAAFEAILLDLPGIAVSQQSDAGTLDFRHEGGAARRRAGTPSGAPPMAGGRQASSGPSTLYFTGGGFRFEVAARFVAGLVERIEDLPLPERTLLNVNVPAAEPSGVEVCRLGKRIYRDRLEIESEARDGRHYRIYGTEPDFEDVPDTDLWAVARGRIAVTPIHFDLTHAPGIEALRAFDLDALV
jgi:5'-nucleotidase